MGGVGTGKMMIIGTETPMGIVSDPFDAIGRYPETDKTRPMTRLSSKPMHFEKE